MQTPVHVRNCVRDREVSVHAGCAACIACCQSNASGGVSLLGG